MHHNLKHALDDMQKAALRVSEEMQRLSPKDIHDAFANNGYMEMRPLSCHFKLVNEAGQYVYNCAWNDDDIGVHFANAYVSLAVDKLLADI